MSIRCCGQGCSDCLLALILQEAPLWTWNGTLWFLTLVSTGRCVESYSISGPAVPSFWAPHHSTPRAFEGLSPSVCSLAAASLRSCMYWVGRGGKEVFAVIVLLVGLLWGAVVFQLPVNQFIFYNCSMKRTSQPINSIYHLSVTSHHWPLTHGSVVCLLSAKITRV